jgi:hypothetical protein
MAYSKYRNIQMVSKKFGIPVVPFSLFSENLTKIKPSDWLIMTLERMSEQGFDTEKERSERLIAPIFAELRYRNLRQLTIYSGHELNIESDNDLNGECDYLLTLGNKVPDYIDKPIFSVVEAKRQDFDLGTGQCAAQMVGVVKYNEAEGSPLPLIYGAATDGVKWRFLKLENNQFWLDSKYYVINDLDELLGVLQYIFEDCKKNQI